MRARRIAPLAALAAAAAGIALPAAAQAGTTEVTFTAGEARAFGSFDPETITVELVANKLRFTVSGVAALIAENPDVAECAPGGGGIECSLGDVLVSGQGNNDALIADLPASFDEFANTIELSGGDGVDTITGSPNSEEIAGGDGDDEVNAGDGADLITGNDGSDTLRGQGGADQIFGEQFLVIGGTPGNDIIEGGDGDDPMLQGGPGNDSIDGGAGADGGGIGGFTGLGGGPGDDDVRGGPGDDAIVDSVNASNPGVDAGDDYAGGDGRDSIALIATKPSGQPSPVTVTLDDVADDGITGANQADNVRSDIEDVTTDGGGDTIVGSAAANRISSGSGPDTVTPGGGADDVRLAGDDDVIRALDGTADTIDCGDGADSGEAESIDVLVACEAGVAITVVPPGAPPAVIPPPDTTAPSVTLKLGTKCRKARDLIRRRCVVTITTGEPAALALSLVAKARAATLAAAGDLVLAEARAPLGSTAAVRKIRIKVGRKLARSLRRGRRVRVVVAATDAAGNAAVSRRAIRLR